MFFFKSQQSYSIDGKVALVTGALGTIGTQITRFLLSKGAKVALVDVADDGSGEQACAEFTSGSEEKAQHAIYIAGDLRSYKDIRRILIQAHDHFGRIDILVNNAGVALYKDFYSDETSEDISSLVDVNLKAPMETTRLFVKMLNARDPESEGAVVNVASIAGLCPIERFEAYGTAKTALIFFTQASGYLAPRIRVAGVAPFFVNSPMAFKVEAVEKLPIVNRHTLVSAKDVAQAVVKQIEDRTSGGKTIIVIGRWNFLPVWQFSASYIYFYFFTLACWIVGNVRRLFGLRYGSEYLSQEKPQTRSQRIHGQKW
ncbi:hypothetical protein H4R99_002168 [Coemansia sp. RSA 1722]|nr:hypothetical protein LPJ57_002203 [Coemansia sp. RSA 486]KAJ2234799.1 hypothetical protein IWW45_003113 [Coemansia sp. RSA 485]KAJ2602102.1 hypothetical protein GGF39_000931 [Coemansia sp. RSA 1721]KAJ2603871.1 hypothetical protein H4R99_002168 [Coemansia sp. RSA 1722]